MAPRIQVETDLSPPVTGHVPLLGGAELKRYRSQLEIVVKTKETASYRVEVSFQVRPLQEQSVVFVSYADKRSGQSGKMLLAKLLSANDVYPLCGSIAVRDNTITIKPRSSSRVAMLTQRYDVPMSVRVDDVLAASSEELRRNKQ